MKKSIIFVIITVLLLAAAGGGMFFLNKKEALMVRNPVLVQSKPVVTYMNGEVFFKNKPDEEWMEPELGQPLKSGALLKTGADGELDIRITNDTLLKMDPDTTMILEKSTLKNLNITLEEGRVYGRFHKMFTEQNLQVRTDTVTAGVRGTDLVFEYENKDSAVYALSGITEVYNPEFPNDKLLLSFQRKTTVKEGERPTQPVPMSFEEVNQFQNAINSIHKETVLLVSTAIQFKPDSSEFLESSSEELERLYKQVDKSKFTLQIGGHTADIGDSGTQFSLSLERAQAVKDYLVERGIKEKRLKVAGFGGSRPVADNATDEGRAQNRRVEFIILE